MMPAFFLLTKLIEQGIAANYEFKIKLKLVYSFCIMSKLRGE